MKKEAMSCIDCAVKSCNKMDKNYPDFCLTTHMDEEVLNEAMECYNSFRVLWIGEALLPQRRFLGGSNHSFFVEMLIS